MTIEFKISKKDGTLEKKVLEEIKDKEDRELLGVTAGHDKHHCLAIAWNRYNQEFRDNVRYYRESNMEEHPGLEDYDIKMILEFYK